MATKFIAEREVWLALKRAFGKGAKAFVAVAFLSKNSTKRLKLSRGSVLVANTSDAALKTGQTCPAELRKYYEKGVNIYRRDELHAKVFVVGRTAFVGSANVSKASETRLAEAMIQTDDPADVTSAREFVRRMAVTEIGPEQLRNLEQKYREPKFPLFGSAAGKPKEFIWCVTLGSINYSTAAEAASREGRPKAEKNLSDSRRFRMEEFEWTGSEAKQFKVGQELVHRWRKGRTLFLYPLGVIVHLEPFKENRSNAYIVFLELPKSRKRRKWVDCASQFPEIAGTVGIKKISGPPVIYRLRRILGTALESAR